MNNNTVTYEPMFEDFRILTNKEKKQGCYEKILNPIKDNLSYMLENHPKTFFMRFDVRSPGDNPIPEDNKIYRDFMANLVKSLDRQNLDPHYVWVREQSREKHQHYHAVLMLDGNLTKSIYNHINKAGELWNRALNLDPAVNTGLVHDCTTGRDGSSQHNGTMLRKDDPALDTKVKSCFEWASYLAKQHTKGKNPKGVRTFGASRINKPDTDDEQS